MIGPLGMQEMLIILVVALIVFGPRKLPQIGKTLGKSVAEFRRTSTELRSTLEREVQMEEFRSARNEVSGLGKEVQNLGRGLDPDTGRGSKSQPDGAAGAKPAEIGGRETGEPGSGTAAASVDGEPQTERDPDGPATEGEADGASSQDTSTGRETGSAKGNGQ